MGKFRQPGACVIDVRNTWKQLSFAMELKELRRLVNYVDITKWKI